MSESDIKVRRGKALRDVRARHGLTAEQLVERATEVSKGAFRLSSAAIYAYESGRVKLGLDAARHIAAALDEPISQLLVDERGGPDEVLDRLLLGGAGTARQAPDRKMETLTNNSCRLRIELKVTSQREGIEPKSISRCWQVLCDPRSGVLALESDGSAPLNNIHLAWLPGNEPEVRLQQKPSRFDHNVASLLPGLPELLKRSDEYSGDLRDSGLLLQLEELVSAQEVIGWLDTREATGLPSAKEMSAHVTDESLRRESLVSELADFLPESIARQMVAAWERKSLQSWLEHAISSDWGDPFEILLIKAVAHLSLQKSHKEAGPIVDALVRHAGENRARLGLAYYLQGRQRWYVDQFGPAVESLNEALRRAEESRDLVRQAQCLIYLARCGTENPIYLDSDPGKLLDRAIELAKATGRLDVLLLARRAEAIWIRAHGQVRESLGHIRAVLAELESENGVTSFPYLVDSLKVDLGITLRRLHSEEARGVAEEIYDEGALLDRQDSHSGMCLYLCGDLYVDRMLDALREANEKKESGDERAYMTALGEAKKYREEALDRFRKSNGLLEMTDDELAKQKSKCRLGYLQGMGFEAPEGPDEAATYYASRKDYISQILMGATLGDAGDAYKTGQALFELNELEELINHIFATRLVATERTNGLEPVALDDYLQPGTLLCVPWTVGDSLVVRLFGRKKDSQRAVNCGWFTIESYGTAFLPKANELLDAIDFDDRKRLQDELYELLHRHLLPVTPVFQKDPIRHVVLIASESRADTLCPIEWLPLPKAKNDAPLMNLLSLARAGVLYAGPGYHPLSGTPIVCPATDIQVFAADQDIVCDDGTVVNILEASRSRLGERVHALPETGVTINGSDGIVIIAHADSEGKLHERLAEWDFSSQRAVMLLFCSSAQHRLARGPFADNLMLRIRQKMASDGVVVGSRVSVAFSEATRFAQELISDSSRFVPVAELVTDYLRRESGLSGDPYTKPWVVM